MNIIRYIQSIPSEIRSFFWVRKQKKKNPLLYSRILKESSETFYDIYGNHPIDENMYIEGFITSAGIQSCGLYFKVKRLEPTDEPSGGAMVYDLCRISMTEPKYIEGYDETFRLNKKQKEKLMDVLKSKYGITEKSLWNHMIDNTINDANYYYPKKIPHIEHLDIPDYTKLPD